MGADNNNNNKLMTNESPEPDCFKSEVYQTFDVQKNSKGGKAPKLTLQGNHYPDSQTRQKHYKKKIWANIPLE